MSIVRTHFDLYELLYSQNVVGRSSSTVETIVSSVEKTKLNDKMDNLVTMEPSLDGLMKII